MSAPSRRAPYLHHRSTRPGKSHHASSAAGSAHGDTEAAEFVATLLAQAHDAGLDCGRTLLTDPALDPLRTRDDFTELVARSAATKTSA